MPVGIRSRPIVGLAVLSVLLLTAASCRTDPPDTVSPPPGDPSATLEADVPPEPGGKIVIDVPAEVNGLNPVINQWSDAGSFEGSAMLEPAVLLDTDGNWKPFLVDTIVSNPDFTQWDLTLKPNITFHNGKPLDGAALKRNIEAFYQGPLGGVVVGKSYTSVEVTGPLSVHVTLAHPWAQYPASLSTYYLMAPEQLDAPDHGVYKAIGTGPFVCELWKQGEFLRTTKNPNYWRKDDRGNQLPYLDAIEFRPVADDTEQANDLTTGSADLALTLSARVATDLEDTFTVVKDYNSERSFIMLNTVQATANYDDPKLPPPFNPLTNVHARRALAYATDRETIADGVGKDVRITTQGYRSDSRWGLPEADDGYYPYDPAKAREEIEKFKQDTGQPVMQLSLMGFTDVENTRLLQTLKDQWRAVGIETSLVTTDHETTAVWFALGRFQAGFFRWYGFLNPDFNYMFNSSTTSHPNGGISINFTGYTSPNMDANLQVVRNSEDYETRKAANDKVIKEINDQAIAIWLYDTPYAVVANKKVLGLNSFRANPFGNFAPKPWFGEIWVKR